MTKKGFSWKLQDFDTKIFGFKVAKIENINFNKNRRDIERIIDLLIEDLKLSHISYATYRLPAIDFPVIQVLEKKNFILIDGIISLEISLSNIKIFKTNKNIREANSRDKEILKSLSSRIFSLNRFYNDPIIVKKKANLLYAKWMENCLNKTAADKVLVWESEGKILGFLAMQKNGTIPLVGVAKNARGKGIAKELVKTALMKLKDINCVKAYIGTQITNIPALRAYQFCGFKPVQTLLTFRWSNII